MNNASQKSEIPADVNQLCRFLGSHQRPILWIGAGASLPAGLPSTRDVLDRLREVATDPLPDGLDFPAIVDAFVKSDGKGKLSQVLHDLLARPVQPSLFHSAVARLARVCAFHTIITTNYDSLIEMALRNANVPFLLQTLQQNQILNGNGIRVIKLHGSLEDCAETILSGTSYFEFSETYPLLCQQLNVLLHQHSVIFVGCSMRDRRILQWLHNLPATSAQNLHPWRPMMTQSEWDGVVKTVFDDGLTGAVLQRGNIRPLIVSNHSMIPDLWNQAANKIAPEMSPKIFDLGLRLGILTAKCVSASLGGQEDDIEEWISLAHSCAARSSVPLGELPDRTTVAPQALAKGIGAARSAVEYLGGPGNVKADSLWLGFCLIFLCKATMDNAPQRGYLESETRRSMNSLKVPTFVQASVLENSDDINVCIAKVDPFVI